MSGPRNRHGVNDAIDCYRTFNGEKYPAWMSFPSSDRILAYRTVGVRCRRLGDELFVHIDDRYLAAAVDAEQDAPAPSQQVGSGGIFTDPMPSQKEKQA